MTRIQMNSLWFFLVLQSNYSLFIYVFILDYLGVCSVTFSYLSVQLKILFKLRSNEGLDWNGYCEKIEGLEG